MKELKQFLHLKAITVAGKTVWENIKDATVYNREVIRLLHDPLHNEGGLAILYGNLAPKGAVVKLSAVPRKMLRHVSPAKIYDSEENAVAAILDGKIAEGDVVVIKYEGLKGGAHSRIKNGDIIEINLPKRKVDVKLSNEIIRERPARWKPKPPKICSGYIQRYIRLVRSADERAAFKEKPC